LQKPASHIALVLFARTAPEEACHKKLLPHLPGARNQPVFEAFNASSLALLAATGLPYFLVSSENQKGHTFGERLYGALAQTFARGFEQVIVIGNDCPQLRVADLHRAVALLSRHDTVLGPCQNGGIYLLGLRKHVFEQVGSFGQIAWQTPAVYQQLSALLQQGPNTLACLALYADINNPQDFRQAQQHNWFRRSLRSCLRRLLDQVVFRVQQPYFLLIPLQYQPATRFRGPPALPY
jgi:glycosyltransferase A (GT-A) superfamily protein (DUF2064 family)